MDYNFNCAGLTMTPDIRAYLDKKLTHVEKFLHSDATYKLEADLRYHAGINDRGERFETAFTLVINGTTLHAQADGLSAYEAIDIASAELAREAARYTSKHKSLVRRGAAKAKEWLRGLTR